MIADKALKFWANACDHTGIRWYLFKETLLCASEYQHLPEELEHPQIVVFAKDLPDLIEFVFPALPKNWLLNKTGLLRKKPRLVFQIKQMPVLEINLLYGVKDESQMVALTNSVDKIL